ncbi:TraM-binding TraD/TraG-like protein [Curtobacterium sp. PhB191]|uniref:type IV secretory system conjugative DNA transfer family protein n=1 Tax=Curtobacterium sp. PhB191 TaxID=2485202 RepID=UPI001048250E|nr:TraM recognition domain-containing protein [Curtobacterium sp. PhB191]TCU82298.1 TraM-binding TraD/TraG-like protein [Curtobacterium sp. PhB191]
MDTIKEFWASAQVYVWMAVVVLAGWTGLHIAADQDPKVGHLSWNPLDVALTALKGRFRMPENGIVFTIGAIIVAVVILMVLWFAVPAIWRAAFGPSKPKAEEGFAGVQELQDRAEIGHKVETTEPYAYIDDHPIRATTEDVATVVAPPRSGKTMRLVIRLILKAFGPVVSTSTKPDVVRLTAWLRSKVGTVHVFDPEGVTKWPNRVKWNIVAGCEDDMEATRRAKAIIAARPLEGASNAGFFAGTAQTVLQCLLHAAALGGHSMRDVVLWSKNFTDDTPYNILRDHPDAAPGWLSDLRKFCRSKAHETVDSTDMSLRLALGALGMQKILDAVCPAEGDQVFDVAAFIESRDTLFLLSESGDASLAAPVITALVSTIEREAKAKATHYATNRLPKPLTLVLDEVANIAPIPGLPALITDGGDRGIITWAILQDPKDAEARWGKAGGNKILKSSNLFMVLGGLKDDDFLESLSKLCSEREAERVGTTESTNGTSTSTSTYKERVLSAGAIYQLEPGKGLLFYRELPPAIVDLPGWWDEADKDSIEEGQTWALKQEGIAA